MKKFINQVEKVEEQMVSGLAKAYPSYLRKLDGMNVVVRAHKKEGKVALISGGGSGHEPAHGGYVGEGMLDAAVAGAVFTSPTPDQIYEGIKAVATEEGVLMIVKNYTGDVMNFEMAAELADMEGIKVKQVVVNDDVAVKDSLYTVAAEAWPGPYLSTKSPGPRRRQAAALRRFRPWPRRLSTMCGPWAWPSLPVRFPLRELPALSFRRMRWRWESASTGSRGPTRSR